MQTRSESFQNSFKDLKKFILKHKAVSLAIITVLVIFVITSSLAHGRRGEKFRDIKDFPREMMGQEVGMGKTLPGQAVGKQLKKPILPLNPNGAIPEPGMGPQAKLYERFCQSGNMQNPEEFLGSFGPGAEKRGQGMIMVQNQVDHMVKKLKKEGYDTSNIETQLQTIKEMLKEFDQGAGDFKKSPEDFCARQTGWIQLNTKIKAIMTGILQEIENIEG